MKTNILKKTITVGIVACILASVLTVIFTNINYQKYVQENNKALLNVINLVLENKDISKTDIAKALLNDEIANPNIILEYGYSLNDKFFILNNENNLFQNVFINLVLVNSIIFIGTVVLYILLKRIEKKIDEIIFYLKDLQDGKYTLEINANEESELSRLQNEIYKITVLLKKQAEKSVNDKQLVKDNIVDISHQLKTPLTSMSIMMDNIIDFPEMDDETKNKFYSSIRERLSHMETLIQNLLKLSRFDANVVLFKDECINVQKLIENSCFKNQILIEQKNINIIVNCDSNIQFIGDFNWQSEAISNIIKNAVEHSFQNGVIEISCKQNNFSTKITIKDYGKGIKKENLNKIFIRYYKDENSSENSLGVGLNLARTIIEKNKGTIKAMSKENEYSIFEIRYLNF